MAFLVPILWVLASLTLCRECEASFVDLKFPNQFHILQDCTYSELRVLDDEKCLGRILNIERGVWVFCDCRLARIGTDRLGSIFNYRNHFLGTVRILAGNEPCKELVFPHKLRSGIFSASGKLLATVETEEDGRVFFRDFDTGDLLAIALLNCIPLEPFFSSWCDDPIQDWEVIILNPAQLQEKNIFSIFLISALLRHGQKVFPDRDRFRH